MRNRALLVASLAVFLGGPALASPADKDDTRVRRASTILLSTDPALPVEEPFEMAPWLAQNLRLDKRGLKYVGRFGDKGEDHVVLRIRGPIMKRNQFGIMLDIRF